MESRSNVVATVSLVCSILLLVCYFAGMCLGFIPFLGIFALILMPIDWLLAIVGLITGIVGYRMSTTMNGAGAVPGIVGALISGLWLLFQIMLFGLVFLMIGGTMVLAVFGAILDSM